MPTVVKKKAKAKGKKSDVIRKGAILDALAEREELVQKRYEYALEIKEAQDGPTVVAINRMIAQMQRMAPNPPVFIYKGHSYIEDEERLKSIQIKNLTWFAIRLFVACAEWDIRIANFKLIKNRCAKCGKKVK